MCSIKIDINKLLVNQQTKSLIIVVTRLQKLESSFSISKLIEPLMARNVNINSLAMSIYKLYLSITTCSNVVLEKQEARSRNSRKNWHTFFHTGMASQYRTERSYSLLSFFICIFVTHKEKYTETKKSDRKRWQTYGDVFRQLPSIFLSNAACTSPEFTQYSEHKLRMNNTHWTKQCFSSILCTACTEFIFFHGFLIISFIFETGLNQRNVVSRSTSYKLSFTTPQRRTLKKRQEGNLTTYSICNRNKQNWQS